MRFGQYATLDEREEYVEACTTKVPWSCRDLYGAAHSFDFLRSVPALDTATDAL